MYKITEKDFRFAPSKFTNRVEKYVVTIVFVFVSFFCFAQIPAGYYDSADGLTGDTLKTVLHNIIKGHTELSYAAVKEALKDTDEDTANPNNVICLYSGWSYAKTEFGNGSEQWNREHVWSKSHGNFGNTPPCGTDLHHLRPADASVNSAKNNRDFDYGATQYVDGSGTTDCYYSTDIWEPRDEVKGDVARMIFYMATRYEGDTGEPDLEVVDYVNTSPNNEPYYGKLSTLIAWNAADPVDDWERNRNNIIYYDYQNNRNPFIDHPEYVNAIWGGVVAEPSNHVTSFQVAGTTGTTITLTWNDNDGAVPAGDYLIKINTSGTFVTPVDGTPELNDTDVTDGEGQYNVAHGIENYTWTGLTPNTVYYFVIYPYTNLGVNINFKTSDPVPSANGSTGVDYLIISEIADPSDVPYAKYLELYNTGTASIDFDTDTWYVCRQANGGSWSDLQLTGTIGAGESFVISYRTTDFFNAFGFNAEMNSSTISGNGNDGYFLYHGGDHTTGTLIDAYGVIDEDGTGKSWNYANTKAVRAYFVTSPNNTWTASEWYINSSATSDQMSPGWGHKTLTWTGSTSGDWSDSSNWSDNGSSSAFPPDAGCQVIVENTTIHPEISNDASCNHILVKGNAKLILHTGGTLHVLGNGN